MLLTVWSIGAMSPEEKKITHDTLMREADRYSAREAGHFCEACARRADEASKVGTAPFLNRKKSQCLTFSPTQ